MRMLCAAEQGTLAPPQPWCGAELFSLAAGVAFNGPKPHQGLASRKPAPHQGLIAGNSTTALGLSWSWQSGTALGARVTYDYDGWGNTVNSTGSTANVYLYRSEQYDPDLGLYYLRARYFNPVSGRFLSRDSADGVPTDPTTLHKYLYASASPVNGIDPSGHNTLIEYTLLLKFIGPLLWPKVVLPNLCMWFPAGPSNGSDDTASCGCDGCKARTPPPNSKGGPDVCAYYGDLCKSCGDKYACNAEKCCRGFGDNKRANCVRLCLVAKDRDCVKDYCKNPTRLKVCRLEIHAACYAKCFYVPGVTAPWSYDKSCWDTFIGK